MVGRRFTGGYIQEDPSDGLGACTHERRHASQVVLVDMKRHGVEQDWHACEEVEYLCAHIIPGRASGAGDFKTATEAGGRNLVRGFLVRLWWPVLFPLVDGYR